MKSRKLFATRVPLSRRLFILCSPFMVLFIILPSDENNTKNSGNFWAAPIEPPGSIRVTINTPTKPVIESASSPQFANADAQVAQVAPVQTFKPTVAPNASVATTVNHEAPSELALLKSLEQWRSAWEAQNLPVYLASYGSNFEPEQKLSRQAWTQARSARISSKQKIKLTLQDLQVQIKADKAVVTFSQLYADERLRLTDRKTLVWHHTGGRWSIQRETTD